MSVFRSEGYQSESFNQALYGENSIYGAIIRCEINKVQQFIQSSTDLSQRNSLGHTPLDLAAYIGCVDIIKLLLNAGSSPPGYLLEEALLNNDSQTTLLLIESGVDVNYKFEEGRTALMQAVSMELTDVVKALVEAGADVNAVSRKAEFALMNTINQDSQELFNYLAPLTAPELRQRAETELQGTNLSNL